MRIGLRYVRDKRFFPLNERGETLLGSGDNCTIIFDEGGVEPQQARIRISPMGIEIDHVASSTPTFVGVYPITKHFLSRADEIRFGSVSLVLEIDPEDRPIGPRCRRCGAEVDGKLKTAPGGSDVVCAYCATRPRQAPTRGSSRWNIASFATPPPPKRETPPRPEGDDFNPIELKHDATTKRFAKIDSRRIPAIPASKNPAALQLDPELVSDYNVIALLGEGSQGRVLKLQHKTTGKLVAAKHLWSAAAKSLSRFEREIAALKRISHPAIVGWIDVRTSHSSTLLLMEFVEGLNLSTIMKRVGSIDPKRGLVLAARLADGLAYAASQKIVHRDVKPSNVIVDANDMPKLVDFGLVKLEDKGTRLTAEGQWIGTPHYMAPEQMTGVEVDARTDVWGLAATFYHAITGKLLFDATAPADLFKKVLQDPLDMKSLSDLTGPAPARLFERMLARNIEDRPTPAEVATELATLAGLS